MRDSRNPYRLLDLLNCHRDQVDSAEGRAESTSECFDMHRGPFGGWESVESGVNNSVH